MQCLRSNRPCLDICKCVCNLSTQSTPTKSYSQTLRQPHEPKLFVVVESYTAAVRLMRNRLNGVMRNNVKLPRAATAKKNFFDSSFSLRFLCDLMRMQDCDKTHKAAARHARKCWYDCCIERRTSKTLEYKK